MEIKKAINSDKTYLFEDKAMWRDGRVANLAFSVDASEREE